MTTILGVQLCGVFFVPLAIGAVTFFLFWAVLSKWNFPSKAVASEYFEKRGISESSEKKTALGKKKKDCKNCDNCCSKKDGKPKTCQDENRMILTAKVFVDKQSEHCKVLAKVLAEKLASIDVPTEDHHVLYEDIDLRTLLKHVNNQSLFIFILHGEPLKKLDVQERASQLQIGERPLTGMQYAVFAFEPNPFDGRCKLDESFDWWLHKSGGVRVCKAASVELSVSTVSQFLPKTNVWLDDLLDQIQKWNTSKGKLCKCGPKKKKLLDEEQVESCSSSATNCSDTSAKGERLKTSVKTSVMDLEDIAQIL